MTSVQCPIEDTYLVRDETQPIPLGKTASNVSVVVHKYSFGWVCDECGYSGDTTKPSCKHVKAAQRYNPGR